jgi:hypothetical protein
VLDVHPPEHGIHGFRDFIVHLLTITVGLLIALGLENAVEALHHRHQRREAETTLRREIQDNRDKLVKILESSSGTRSNMVRALEYLQDRRDGRPGNASGITFAFSEGPLESTGWKTTLATGTVSFMKTSEVQKYAGAYQEQQLFEDAEGRALEHVERLDSYTQQSQDPSKLNPKDLVDAIPDVRNVISDLSAMQDLGRGTLAAYAEVLNK